MNALIFDYGAGNLFSLVKALEFIGVSPRIETDLATCAQSGELLILPGVGAFGPAAERLGGAREQVAAQLRGGRPCVGICLGMQLLFTSSEEGPGAGLGVFEGPVRKLGTKRCPHLGWSKVGAGDYYFAHSYACHPAERSVVRASARFEAEEIAAIVKTARTIGVQFHPEKSSKGGLELLGALIKEVTS
jgi:glutamine amidotransferase